ncbi:hypothetical protein P7H84_12760 [Lactococcus lactis]|nr:hypothetical protein [Lactococcus lactis]
MLDIFIVGLVKEMFFSDDLNILTFIRESIAYNFTHISFTGILGGIGMFLLAILFIFTPICFLIVNWEQLKSCFQKNKTAETLGTSGLPQMGPTRK